MICEICNKKFKDLKGLSIHLGCYHKFDNIQMKKYYDTYIKKENDGICYFCGNESKYINLIKGYHRICESKECIGKTRATSTYQFLMYKYGLSEEDAKIEQQKRADVRSKRLKESFDKLLKEDSDFHKKRSHQTKEYWLNKGFSEEESIKKAKTILTDMHNKVWEKRRNNPELYQDVSTTQLNYWIKKGFSEEEANDKITERQATFTLEKCILKYGEELGTLKYTERHKKWSDKIEKKYKNGDFQKFPKDIYSKPEIDLMKKICETLKIDAKYGDNQYFRHFSDIGKTFAYDFYYNNKIIEFNGDYWHCNPDKYAYDYYNKQKKKYAYEIWEQDTLKIDSIKNEGFDVLIIWENDYKKNKKQILQQCVEFLK